jgi:hypothetical protein
VRAEIISIFKYKIGMIRKNTYSLINDSMKARNR